MSQVVTVEQKHPEPPSRRCSDMPVGTVGIVTADRCMGKLVGEPVARAGHEIVFPKSRSWTSQKGNYDYRPLKPGERVVIEGVE